MNCNPTNNPSHICYECDGSKPMKKNSDEVPMKVGKRQKQAFEDGYHIGHREAGMDIKTRSVIDVTEFDGEENDFLDLYGLGYELGYKTRLAEEVKR